MPTAAKPTALVSTHELEQLAYLERKYVEAKRKVSELEFDLKPLRQALAEKVLGVKSSDELKQLSPKEVEKLFAKRLTNGDWKPERSAPAFVFRKTSEGRYPAWKQIFIELKGEAAAAEIHSNTPPIYSYAVEVAAQ